MGVPALIVNGETIVDDTARANALNMYFQKMFHDGTFNVAPHYVPIIESPMPSLRITREGIVKLLHSLDTTKSQGPDGIPSVVLKACSEVISNYLALFRRSRAWIHPA